MAPGLVPVDHVCDDVAVRRQPWRWYLTAGASLIALALCALGTAYLGSFFERRGLDQADKLASVGGLFVGIAGLGISAVGLVLGALALRRPAEAVPAGRAAVPYPVEPAGPVEPDAELDAELRADLDRARGVANIDHDRLFGIEEELTTLAACLANPAGDTIVSIWGGPGVGKTALAYELIKRHAAEAGFHRIASVSAKFSHIDRVGHLEVDSRRAAIDWRDLLVEVAQQLAPRADFSSGLIEEQLPRALPARPCLIFVDNLETTQEAEVAVRYLAGSGVTGLHKVLLTTRESVAGLGVRGLRERRWEGPGTAAAADFARYLGGDDPTLDPTERDITDVVSAAERSPLLIQIIINQAREERLTIREVISRLRDAGGSLGAAVWSYCYAHSLNVLAGRVGEETTAMLMSVFCFRPAGSSFTSDEFFRLSGITERELFNRARATACKLALVRSLAGNSRFTVHSLLREFYCADPMEANPPEANLQEANLQEADPMESA